MQYEDFKIHPAADDYPLMAGEDFEDFVEDVRVNGIKNPIVFLEDVLIDGRNRLRAAIVLGIDLQECSVSLKADLIPDPVGYIRSLNLYRRHLTDSQRVYQRAKLKQDSKKTCGDSEKQLLTDQQIADEVGVSRRSVIDANRVLKSGIPELNEAVVQGKMSVASAGEVARLPKAKQKRVFSQGGVKAAQAAANNIRKHKPVSVKDHDPVSEFDPANLEGKEPDGQAADRFDAIVDQIRSNIDGVKKDLGPFVRALDAVNNEKTFPDYPALMGIYRRMYDLSDDLSKVASRFVSTWIKAKGRR